MAGAGFSVSVTDAAYKMYPKSAVIVCLPVPLALFYPKLSIGRRLRCRLTAGVTAKAQRR